MFAVGDKVTNAEFLDILNKRFGGDKEQKKQNNYELAENIGGQFNARMNNYTQIKEYRLSDGSKRYKLVYMGSCRRKGLEAEFEEKKPIKEQFEDGYLYDYKLDSSLARSKRTIFDYSLCNDWDYFFTGTLDKNKYNRFDLDKYHKDLTQWFRNLRRYYDCEIKFLIVPEMHKNGAWHTHGFIKGISSEIITKWSYDDKPPKNIKAGLDAGRELYNIPKYAKKFGFVWLERIHDTFAISAYCTKYITKELIANVKDVGAHSYYCSRGLKKPDTIASGSLNDFKFSKDFNDIVWDSENDYCKVKWLDDDNITKYIDKLQG